MKGSSPCLPCRIALLATALLVSVSAEPIALKDAYQGDFLVGVAINRTIPTGMAVKADNTDRTLDQVKKDMEVVIGHFNQIAPENDLKWALIHPREDKDGYDFAPADAFVEFGVKNDLYFIGHTLVWHGQTPAWVFAGTHTSPASPASVNTPAGSAPPRRRGFDPTQPHASREELIERMREHIHTVVGRYKGKIKVWDVVNEAISDGGPEVLRNTAWSQIIGPDFIAKAFEYAREADPDAILRYNDYGLENPEKRRRPRRKPDNFIENQNR